MATATATATQQQSLGAVSLQQSQRSFPAVHNQHKNINQFAQICFVKKWRSGGLASDKWRGSEICYCRRYEEWHPRELEPIEFTKAR